MAHKKVISLVSRLQSNKGLQTRKDVLRDFLAWFLKEKPELDAYSIRVLLQGDIANGYSLGIIQFCGKQKNPEQTTYSPGNDNFSRYQYKESVKVALELWVSCIHESFGLHAQAFLEEMGKFRPGVFIEARLDIHIQREEMRDEAGILIDAIIHTTKSKLEETLPSTPAQDAFKKWYRLKWGGEYTENEEDDGKTAGDSSHTLHDDHIMKQHKKKKPTKWEDVKEEDLIIDNDEDHANDEWFDTLDFVGKKKMVAEDEEDGGGDGQFIINDEDEDDDDDDYGEVLFEDPLGQKRRTEVKQCIDKFNRKKKAFGELRTNNDIIDTYYQFSPNILEENFNATNFLVEIHADSEFDELQNGLDKIVEFNKDRSNRMKSLVREHFDQFVYCKDTIDNIHLMLNDNKMLQKTGTVCKELKQIEENAINIYGDVLNRSKKAKVLYETLKLIKQPSFKFLFTLPQTIKYHIMMRNYDQIIRTYKRVKSIETQIDNNELLVNILRTLNNTVQKLRENLMGKLKESVSFGDEEERIIRYLIELDCAENPAIYFLKQRYQSIVDKLDECHKTYAQRIVIENVQENNEDAIHSQRKFVKKLCQTFNHYIPSFWKLSKSIIDSKFTESTMQSNDGKDEDSRRDRSGTEIRRRHRKRTVDTQNERIVKRLFNDITGKFVNYIYLAINPMDTKQKHRRKSHLYYIESSKDTVRLLLAAYSEIKAMKISMEYIFGIDRLISKIVKSFLHFLFERSLKYILNSLSVEKWKPHRDIPGVTTTPLIFSDEIAKNMQIVVDIGIKTIYDADDIYNAHLLENAVNDEEQSGDDQDQFEDDDYIPFKDDRSLTPSNVSKLSDEDRFGVNGVNERMDVDDSMVHEDGTQQQYEVNSQWLVPLIGAYFIDSHKIFADCLHELVFASSKEDKSKREEEAVNNNKAPGNKKIAILSNYSDKSSDKKLLYILGNTIYTKETILEKIWTKYIKKSGIIGLEFISILETPKNDLIELYTTLEQMVFNRYVRCKTLLLNRVIDDSLLCDGINWETVSEVKGIRNHCLQLLLHFVFIHNEVYNSSKQELDNVLISLLEKVADHFLSTIKMVDSFSPSGALQILVEVDFVRNTLSKYLQADGSQIVFQQIKQLLYQWMDQEHNTIQKRKRALTDHTMQSTSVMFSCFASDARKYNQCSYWNQWCWLITFAAVYFIGFLAFLPSLRSDNQDSATNTTNAIVSSSSSSSRDLPKAGGNHDCSFVFNNNNDLPEIPPEIIGVEASNIESWRIVENNDSFAINHNENLEGKPIPLRHAWGTKYRTRILCLVPTLWPDRKAKMDIISKTWGKGCSKLMWVVDEEQNAPSSYAGHDTLIIPLTRKQNNEKHVRNIWEKVHRMWSKVYSTPELLYNFEYFIKADDDTFIATENLFGFLQYYDSSFPHYIGHSIRSRWSSENVVFNSGICYILSRETIRRIGFYQQHLPTLGTSPGRSHCIDRDGAGEDPTTGICLLGVGIRPQNTLDHNLRERFLIFRDTDHQKIFREDTWFWKYKPEGVGEGMDCCSPYLISMHNYKSVHDAEHFFPILMEKYNQPKDWDNIVLPPRPRWFLYARKGSEQFGIDFEIDEWLNVENPPKGQRVYKGPGKEWTCWKCDTGNPKDPYWTEWWDGKQTEPSQHVDDAYASICPSS